MLLMRRFQGFGLIGPFFEFQPGALGWKRAEKRVPIVFDSGCYQKSKVGVHRKV
jgi:hypothetical protein